MTHKKNFWAHFYISTKINALKNAIFRKNTIFDPSVQTYFFTKNIWMNHTRTRHSESSRSDNFSLSNNFPPFVWNLVEYKKTYFSYFYYLIYISHTPVPPKYQFELTLTGDVTINLQLWVRVVVVKATGFLCCRCI